MKRIYTLMAAALMMAGTALWSGCSSNELLDNTTPTEKNGQPGSISFSLKGMGTATRATEAATDPESKINTMYVALFLKNADDEAGSKLHRIFYAGETSTPDGFNENLAMTIDDANKTYTIDKMQETNTYTGAYVAYFIANPDAKAKGLMKTYLGTEGDTRTTLAQFEEGMEVETVAKEDARGFVMVSEKKDIEVGDSPKSYSIELIRLAARFDFINSAPASATITSVTFKKSAETNSYIIPKAENTDNRWLTASTTKSWPTAPDETKSSTIYTYENLNTEGNGNTNYCYIEVAYTLASESGANKTLTIRLKEGDTPLAVMRNHLYRINLNCLSDTYDLTVEQWKDGATVTIPNKELAITYTADSLGKVGDYVYLADDNTLSFSDGGLRKMYLDGSLDWDTRPNRDMTKNCIGLVISRNPSEADKALGYHNGYIVYKEKLKSGAAWPYIGHNR
ncbi:MAG: hypothetical protein LUE99_00680 [Bacteroides sp.]|nr:hypothetical protein [Bacteroides sp.]